MNIEEQNNAFILLKEKYARHEQILIQAYKSLKLKEKESNELNNRLQESEEELKQINEELHTTNDQLLAQTNELESAKIQLLTMNSNLETLVKKRTSKLRSTIDKLNKTVSDLDRFVYSASHDLSAPLKSILGLLDIARKDPDKSQTHKYHDYIEKSIHILEEVIKSLISYSRNSLLKVNHEPLNLFEIVNEVADELAFLPFSETFEIIIEINQDQIIESDRQRLKVVLHNLLNNSIKYADYEKPNSYVKVGFTKNENGYEISVTDNGMGISPDQIEKIFEVFYRGTEKSEGSGLGLFIVKETLSALDGNIKVSSEIGNETQFIINLPR
jgi:signal transduction histidine kinase